MIQKVDNYCCPNCGKESGHDRNRSTLIEQTKPIFTGDYKQFDNEPGGVWIEIHKCDNCETLYCYENGC